MPGKVFIGKWAPIQKGGDFRLWYGNQDYVVNWENDGWEMKNDNFDGQRVRSHNYNGEQAFKAGITWNSISSSRFHCRYTPQGFLFDAAGPLCEIKGISLNYVLGLMSSSVFVAFMSFMNPTMNFPPGYLCVAPLVVEAEDDVESIVGTQISLSKSDWDSFETSWDFKRHPLV